MNVLDGKLARLFRRAERGLLGSDQLFQWRRIRDWRDLIDECLYQVVEVPLRAF